MRVLSLFSGIGLHDLGLTRAGMEIVGQCEIDPFALAVLEKYWPTVHRWKDIKDVTVESIREKCGHIDLITGGFPCTQVSAAGKGEGIGTEESPTEKSGLVWELLRIIRGVRPHWLILENVPRLRTLGADEILHELEQAGYACWPLVVGANCAGLPHERKRVWIVCHLADCSGSGCLPGSGLWGNGEPRGRRESDGEYRQDVSGTLAKSSGERLAERRSMPIGEGTQESVLASSSANRVPMGRCPWQYEWEPPRSLEFSLDRRATRSLRRLLRSTDENSLEALSLSTTQNEALEKWANEEALKCFGNANPPFTMEAIGGAIIKLETQNKAPGAQLWHLPSK